MSKPIKSICYNEVQTARKVIALTFDDGPHPVNTPEILKVLRKFDVKATFYVVGFEVDLFPSILREVVAQGHEIGNHTYTHPHLSDLSPEQQRAEIDLTNQSIEKAANLKPMTFRPPFLEYDDSLLEVSASLGYPVINGYSSDDWSIPGVDHIVDSILNQIGSGVIILCHDGGGNRSQTVAACEVIIPILLSQGYEFITVSELLAL